MELHILVKMDRMFLGYTIRPKEIKIVRTRYTWSVLNAAVIFSSRNKYIKTQMGIHL